MVELIKENIEKVRQAQLREKERLAQEAAKLTAAKTDLKGQSHENFQTTYKTSADFLKTCPQCSGSVTFWYGFGFSDPYL